MHRQTEVIAVLVVLGATSCVGARLGYRWSLDDGERQGIYGGPHLFAGGEVSDGSDPITLIGGDVSYLFVGGPEAGDILVVAPGVVHIPDLGSSTPSVMLGVGVELGDGVTVNGFACGGWMSLAYGMACVRGSGNGWIGAELLAGTWAPLLVTSGSRRDY